MAIILIDMRRCPFCGSDDLDPVFWAQSDEAGKITHGPGCNECEATARSIDQWNDRVTELYSPFVSVECGSDLLPSAEG